MRPNFLLFAPALLVAGRKRAAAVMTGVFAAGVLATIPVMHPASWPSYLAMGDQYYRSLWNADALPDIDRPAHPGIVESHDSGRLFTNITSRSFAVLYQTWHERGVLPPLNLGLASKLLMIGLGTLLLGILLCRRRDGSNGTAFRVALHRDAAPSVVGYGWRDRAGDDAHAGCRRDTRNRTPCDGARRADAAPT